MNKIFILLLVGILLLGCAQQGGTPGTGTTGSSGGTTAGGNGGQVVGVGGTIGGSSGGSSGSSNGSSGGGSSGGTGGSGGAVVGVETPTPGAEDVTVHIRNFAFEPHDVTIKQGHTVFWINEDTTPHTVRIIGVMDSPYISKDGGPFWHTFTEEPGRYDYTCAIHGTMAGTVTVVR